jgi:hypothetical protein
MSGWFDKDSEFWRKPMPKTMRFPVFPWQRGYAPTWRGRYARLNQAEQSLMTWYLELRGDLVDQVWYDVRTDGNPEHLQRPIPFELTDDPAMVRMWWHQNARRIDAVTLEAGSYHIIELREIAGAQTIGELVMYQELARAEWPELPWSNTVLITRNIADPIRATLRAQGITIAHG